MLLRLTNLNGLLLLLYFLYNKQTWLLSINNHNILSAPLVKIIQNIPSVLLTLIFILLILFYIRGIITNKDSGILYIITLILSTILLKIALSCLMLEDTTTFAFFEIHHPVPLAWKLNYFQMSLYDVILANNPEIFADRESLQLWQIYLNSNLDIERIKTLNAFGLTEYCYELSQNKMNLEQDIVSRKYVILTTGLTLGYILYHIYTNAITYLF